MNVLRGLKGCRKLIGRCLAFNDINSHVRSLECIDEICKNLLPVFTESHAMLRHGYTRHPSAWDTVELSFSQIVCCILYYEKALNEEALHGVNCESNRQHFLERINFCFVQIELVINAYINNPVDLTAEITLGDPNFVTCMDLALELIAPYAQDCLGRSSEMTNDYAERQAAIIESVQIVSVVESLISETMAFRNVAMESDREALMALCRNVLCQSIAFRNQCNPVDLSVLGEQNGRLKASQLEAALFKLEKFVNDALLRLVLQVFVELRSNPLEKFANSVPSIEQQAIDEFDCLLDRISQIGVFAVSFAINRTDRIKLRSALASVEALNSSIIPFLRFTNKSVKLMESHWLEETSYMQRSIQKIIDTGAFSECLIELIESDLKLLTENYNVAIAQRLADRAAVFVQHLQINKDEELKGKLSDDVKTMFMEVNECVRLEIPKEKILKRIKILLSAITKINTALKGSTSVLVKEGGNTNAMLSDGADGDTSSEEEAAVKCTAIEASPSKIFYGVDTTAPVHSLTLNSAIKTCALFQSNPRRHSLRIAMFKKNQVDMAEEDDDSMELNLTSILEQLGDLSSDFSSKATAIKKAKK